MALENVLDEIISQADKQKREIIEQGKQEAWKLLDEASNKARQREKFFTEETAKLLDENKKMEVSAANIKLHKMFLVAKRSVLEQIYAATVEAIRDMDAATKKQLLSRLIDKATKELPDAKFFYCNPQDKELIGKISNLQFRGNVDCIGGVVVSNASDSMRINYTFDVLLQNTREANLNEISKRIFKT